MRYLNKKTYSFLYLGLIIFMTAAHHLFSQAIVNAPDRFPDTSRFADSARHWYSIFDEERVIEPLADQKRYDQSEIKKIANNILLFQKDNGGWAKNYDMRAILTDEQVKAVLKSKDAQNTTFDNGATTSQLTYLAEAYTTTKDESYKDTFLKGIEFVLKAQYENGGWPQFYPDTTGYRMHITFNDDAMILIMKMLQAIVNKDARYSFIDDELRTILDVSYKKGIECILKCQIVENGTKTAWCQQHDHVDFSPQDARSFEKASICNMESAQITKFLMSIKSPDSKVIDAIESAINWFQKSEIKGIKVKWIESSDTAFIYHKTNYDKIVEKDVNAPRIWARFYKLGSHRPFFCSRNGEVAYALSEIDRDRRTGYAWYNYAPEDVYSLYAEWQKRWTPGGNLFPK